MLPLSVLLDLPLSNDRGSDLVFDDKASGLSRNSLAELWLTFHAEQERKFARRLKAVWEAVGTEVLKGLKPGIEAGLTGHAVVQAALSGQNLENLLRDTADAAVRATMRVAAVREMKLYAPNKLYQRWQTKENKEIPPAVAAMILTLGDELLKRPQWVRIIETYRDDIVEVIRQGVVRGENPGQIMGALELLLGPAGSTARAIRTASTETTAALSAGQTAGRVPLYALGLIDTKEWLGIMDDKIRDSHFDADGQVVKYTEYFVVGGELARWPGDPNLSAANRINCRCTTMIRLVKNARFAQVSEEEALRIFGL